MKKDYEAPKAEVVKFQYKDQVVTASTTPCYENGHQIYSVTDDCRDVLSDTMNG